jgi:hypothetical protein
LLPLEQVDEVIDQWPERCPACAHVCTERERVDAAAVQRHQVSELPPIAVTATEHRLHRLRCPACAAATRAELPAGVPRSAFGPRLQSAVATLAVRNRVSAATGLSSGRALRRQALDRLDRGDRRARGDALAEPTRDCATRSAPPRRSTSTRPAGARQDSGARSWAALTERAAVFRIAPDRHEREARALLGEQFAGVACSDRWWAYNYLDPHQRQLCWSHLVRDFTAHSEGLAAQKEFGKAGLVIAASLFEAWEEFRGDSDRARLHERLAPLKQELRALLEQAARKSTKTKHHRLFAKNLLKHWPALWAFTHIAGVEPTNNHAERGLRGAVIYRKLSLGSQSDRGERTTERQLSASVTCRLQGRSLFAYLSDVLNAAIRGDPIPQLA